MRRKRKDNDGKSERGEEKKERKGEERMKSIAIIVPVLIAVAFVTLAERKVLGSIQLRKGPNVVGIGGIMQPMADGVKLFAKETIIPTHSNTVIYMIAPILGLTMALISWAVVPVSEGAVAVD